MTGPADPILAQGSLPGGCPGRGADHSLVAASRGAGRTVGQYRKDTFVEALYRDHWSALVSWLRRRYGAGAVDPEDIAQAVFARIATLDDVSHIRDPRTYLYTAAMNTAINSIGWLKRARTFIDEELGAAGEVVDEIDPERVYLAKDHLERIVGILDGLSAKQRTILIRSRFLGQTHREITAATGWSNADISRNLAATIALIDQALSEVRAAPQNIPRFGDRKRAAQSRNWPF